jgi:hypothetical protein
MHLAPRRRADHAILFVDNIEPFLVGHAAS